LNFADSENVLLLVAENFGFFFLEEIFNSFDGH